MNKKYCRVCALAIIAVANSSLFTLHSSCAEAPDLWPVTPESKPYTRWWWLGSAVDEQGLTYNLEEMAKAGIGGVEITPIYGVQGNEKNEIPFLSPRWMHMLKYTQTEAHRLGIQVDMQTGTGWPFGGPTVTEADAAQKLEDGKSVPTRQKVKRAAPGGEGYVLDHFNKKAVERYLSRFDSAFRDSISLPLRGEGLGIGAFFNDSYEVYGADWTPNLLSEFKARRGYDLTPHLSSLTKDESLRTDEDRRIISDYRETLSDLLYENFTLTWTDWAHRHGSLTRNQAHGSPANLLDLYAAVDIPECEGFGLSDFGINGLRRDEGFTKKNFSDISMLKYASSGAHLSGHNLVSSETFTWLTEHFRTSLSQCKPDLDLMFVSGVNHVYFHGACYSPKGEDWPGWRFYASVDMSPNNNWWSAMPAFSQYITRCQSMLQWGNPDNDVLVYLPFYDMIYEQPGTVALFDIHSMEKRAPKFISAVQSIIQVGYDVDYISDRYILKDDVVKRYKAIIVPGVQFMPLATLQKLADLAASGYKVVFVGNYPQSVPGYGKTKQQHQFQKILKTVKQQIPLAIDYQMALKNTDARIEPMRLHQGLSLVRRSNPTGHHYFISNLQSKDIYQFVELGVKAKHAMFYNPMTGDVTRAKMDEKDRVLIQLKSGESIILRTFTSDETLKAFAGWNSLPPFRYHNLLEHHSEILTGWTLSFKSAAPTPIPDLFEMYTPKSWTELGHSLCNTTMAKGVYHTKFNLSTIQKNMAYVLDLGDVRETAHIILNGHDCGTLFAVPYLTDITDFVQEGENTLDIEVCNLPANRIAELDRQNVKWRHFKDINVVDLNYKKALYTDWEPVPSGLCSEVRIILANVE